MTADLLPLAEAFRLILKRIYPERPRLAGRIKSYQFFHAAQRRDWSKRKITSREQLPLWVMRPFEALDILKRGVWDGKIGLRGTLNGDRPAQIDPIDATQGELDVFAGTLKIFESGDTLRSSRVYTNVHCHAADLPLPKGKGGRKPIMDKGAVSAEVLRLMDHHGDFRPDDPDWNAEARLKEAIRAKFGEAADSTLESYIKPPLEQWRQSKRPSPKT